jgi:hypothetical protein
MSRRSGLIAVLVIGIVAGLSSASAANSPFSPFTQTGFSGLHDTHTVFPYEHVDPAPGGLVLVQTDLVLPGNAGFNLVVQRVYNSKIHPFYEHGDLTLEERSWVGVGWRLHFGRIINPDSLVPGETQIETPDGGRQPLYRTTAFPEGWITRSFARYDRSTHTLKLPNGLTYVFGHVAQTSGLLGPVRYVTEISDAFNNRLTFTYFSAPGPTDGIQQIRQDLGLGQVREITFTLNPSTNALATMTYGGRTWTYETQPANVPNHAVLRSTERPAGLTRWQYDYDYTLPGGELTLLEAPSGGQVHYLYEDRQRVVGSRQVLTRASPSAPRRGRISPSAPGRSRTARARIRTPASSRHPAGSRPTASRGWAPRGRSPRGAADSW